MSKLTAVEAIVRSFKNQYDREVASGEVDDFWFAHLTERSSVLLPEVSVDDAIILYNKYGITTTNDRIGAGRCIYQIEDLDKFISAV